MTENSLKELYFKWLCRLAFPYVNTRMLYSHVLYLLYVTEFNYIIPLDENRLKDGIDLRYQFSCDCKIPYDMVQAEIPECSCSILEVLLALAQRWEKYIMSDLAYGDRTSEWFKLMFDNLGLTYYTDSKFENDIGHGRLFAHSQVINILNTFNKREYNYDGSGGNIIIIKDSVYDLRTLELWDQICLYTDLIFQKED